MHVLMLPSLGDTINSPVMSGSIFSPILIEQVLAPFLAFLYIPAVEG